MLLNVVFIGISLQANVGQVFDDTEAAEAKDCIIEHEFEVIVIARSFLVAT
jgi:hypothetical protein